MSELAPDLNRPLATLAPPAPPPVPPTAPPIPPERGPSPPAPPSGDPPPNFWEDHAVLREIFLAYVTDPEVNGALRIVGRHLFDLVLEWDRWPRPSESSVVEGLRAAIADLRVMGAFLHDIGAAHKVSSLDAEDERLSRRAEAWTRQLRRLTADIEEALPERELPS